VSFDFVKEDRRVGMYYFYVLDPEFGPGSDVGPKTNAPEANSAPVDRIPYSPRRHLMPNDVDELIAGYRLA